MGKRHEILNKQQGSLIFRLSATNEVIAGVSLCSPRYVPRTHEVVTIAGTKYIVESVNSSLEQQKVKDNLVYLQNIEVLVNLALNK